MIRLENVVKKSLQDILKIGLAIFNRVSKNQKRLCITQSNIVYGKKEYINKSVLQ